MLSHSVILAILQFTFHNHWHACEANTILKDETASSDSLGQAENKLEDAINPLDGLAQACEGHDGECDDGVGFLQHEMLSRKGAGVLTEPTFVKAPGTWVKGQSGQDCNEVCTSVGKFCSVTELNTLTTYPLLEAAFKEAGYICKGPHGHRYYAGVPFSTGRRDDCGPLTPGRFARCAGNAYPHHARLCYCKEAPTPAPTPAPTRAPTPAPPQGVWSKHSAKNCYSGAGATGVQIIKGNHHQGECRNNVASAEDCKTLCLQSTGCEAVVHFYVFCCARKDVHLGSCKADGVYTTYIYHQIA